MAVNQIYILEGPDGGGKTTLANELSRAFDDWMNVEVHHHGPYPDDRQPWYRYLESLLTAIENERQVVILDRSWLSEYPYGRIYRGYARFDEAAARGLERLAFSLGAVVVDCVPSVESVVEAFKARKGEEYVGNAAAIRDIHRWYDRELQATATSLPVYRYDRDAEGVEETAANVIAFANRAYGEPDLSDDPVLVGLLGPIDRARVLLLGDRPNGRYDLPFVGLKGCTSWLSNRLADANVDERDLAWFNVRDTDGRFKDPEPIYDLVKDHDVYVVALGSVARAWSDNAGIELSACVPHPQYWKRFHHHETYPLVNVLTKELRI